MNAANAITHPRLGFVATHKITLTAISKVFGTANTA